MQLRDIVSIHVNRITEKLLIISTLIDPGLDFNTYNVKPSYD